MTNKPILSVERELLGSCWAALMQKGQVIKALELRALLDKPAATDFESWWAETGEQLTKHEIGLKDLMQCAYDAAQHQGDPVAICRLWNEGGSGERTSVEFINEPCADGTLLYAEKPAPLAVVMPDVDELAQIIRKVDGSHTLGAGSLAEAILEEVVRLNGVKP